MEPKLRLEASSEGQVEPKWRLEATLEGQVEPEWRLEATLEGQVDLGERLERSKLGWESDWRGVQGPRTAPGRGCRVQVGGGDFSPSVRPGGIRSTLAKH